MLLAGLIGGQSFPPLSHPSVPINAVDFASMMEQSVLVCAWRMLPVENCGFIMRWAEKHTNKTGKNSAPLFCKHLSFAF